MLMREGMSGLAGWMSQLMERFSNLRLLFVQADLPVPIALLVGKEIELAGTHRFHAEFAEAVALIDTGRIDPTPIVTDTLPVERAVEAFTLAGDRARAVKVQLSFG